MEQLVSPQLLLPEDYISQAAGLARQARRRIYIVSMSLVDCPATHDLIDAVLSAARQGVDVHIDADLLTFIWNRGARLTSALAGQRQRTTDQLRRDLQQAGAKFRWLGLQRVPYVLGRTHSKWTIIDDDIFTFGGVNLDQSGIAERNDYIFHLRDPDIADRLVHEQQLIERVDLSLRRVRNHEVQTAYGTMLLDSGRFNQSIIYDHAIKLAEAAQELLIVTQYCPTGKLGQILRDKKARVYFNPKGSAVDPINNVMIGDKNVVDGQLNLYHRSKYLHAKFMIGTMPDGSRRAITGSHNFTAIGVRTGTREIALETAESSIIKQLENFYDRFVK